MGISPSWFRLHPSLPVLYTTNETFDGSDSSVTAFGITPTGGLERMGRVTTGGGSACHFSVHPRCGYLAATNHGQDFGGNAGGSVAVISLDAASGDVVAQTDHVVHEQPTDAALLADPAREDWTPHAHSANWSLCGRFLFVCEKGTDRIIVYAFDEASGKISNHSECMVTIGGGARHIAVHPDGNHIFCNEEAGARVTAYDWDAEAGVLTPTQTLSTLPENHGLPEVFTAECSLNAAADVLYGKCSRSLLRLLSAPKKRLGPVANRVWPPVPGKDDGLLATFGVDADGGLEARGHVKVGRHPRHFQIDPTGQWLVCSSLHEHRVDVFRLDERGVPHPTESSITVPSVTHSLWIPQERWPAAAGSL